MPINFSLRTWLYIAFALVLAWGMRVDHLRAGYKDRLNSIKIAFEDMGEKPKGFDDLVPVVNKVGAERARYKRERDQERAANEIMAGSIKRAAAETEQALQESADAQRKVAELTKQRDHWIAKARAASTRVERMEAEKELAECVSAMSELRRQGF